MLEFARRLEQSRGVLLVGPRQVGTTTLARSYVAPDSPNYFDLEDVVVAAHSSAGHPRRE